MSFTKTGTRICCNGSNSSDAQEDAKYYVMLIMTATSGRTSPPTMLSQRRDRRSGLLRSIRFVRVDWLFSLSNRRMNLLFESLCHLTSKRPFSPRSWAQFMNPESDLESSLRSRNGFVIAKFFDVDGMFISKSPISTPVVHGNTTIRACRKCPV